MSAYKPDSAALYKSAGMAVASAAAPRREPPHKTDALQSAILNSANFSIIATDENGIIQLFNIGAERMLGYAAAEMVALVQPNSAMKGSK